jgi:hypothetical protein
MKSFKKGIAILLIATVTFMSFGCYGNFPLFKKINTWNGSLSNKFINTIVYWVLWILPVYEICIAVDWLLLNTIQWWTGSSPISMNDGEREVQIVNNEGVNYEIVATKNRFDITVLDGQKAGTHTSLVYNDNTMIWSVENGAEKIEVAQTDSDNPEKMRLLLPGMEGKIVDVKM